MKLRTARHTDRLEEVVSFYIENLGLKILGSFKDHDSYDGVFIGKEKADWHLEFTTSGSKAKHLSDEDDLIVFYCDSQDEFEIIRENFKRNNIPAVKAKNPYWQQNGLTYLDPDGFRIVISLNKLNF